MATSEIYNANKKELFVEATERIFAQIGSIEGDFITIGLCGGRSIVGLLEVMREKEDGLPKEIWNKLQFFMVDERLVALDSEDSNFKLVNELFLASAVESGFISQEQVHPFLYQEQLPDGGIDAYNKELAEFGGALNVVFLGVGEDAHVAALFPGFEWPDESETGFFSFTNSPKPPSGRMSSSPGMILNADLAVALFIGDGKAEALAQYRNVEADLATCPVKIVDRVTRALLLRTIDG